MIVVWRITTRCNLACPFCAYDRRLPFPRISAEPSAVRSFCDALADFHRTSGRPVLLSWLGGEPLLNGQLPALTRHAVSVGLRVSATTNGTSLHSTTLRQHILDHYAELTVSLDAADTRHDGLRGWPGGFDSLRHSVTALANARTVQRRPLKLRINTVLLRDTIADFPRLVREVATWGADELTFNLLGGRDRPEFHAAHRPHGDQVGAFAAALPALHAEAAARGLVITGGPAYLERLRAAAADEAWPVANCGAAERFLFIDEHGIVAPCSFTTASLGVPVAELRSGADIAALPLRFARARAQAQPASCADCPSTQVFAKFAPAA